MLPFPVKAEWVFWFMLTQNGGRNDFQGDLGLCNDSQHHQLHFI